MNDIWQLYLLSVIVAFIAHLTLASAITFAICCFKVKAFKRCFPMLLGGAIGCSAGIAIIIPMIYFTR